MKLTSRKSLSRLVLRAMGIFGGVQSLQILCGVIRMKLVSLWIGPAGVGLFSIFNQAIDLVATATQLSLRTSAVRDVAAARQKTAAVLAALVITVRRCGWFLGLLGALVMLIASPWLSLSTFGDYSHSFQYVLLSVSVFFSALISSESAILQGLERYRPLALGSLWGALGGLVVSIPMYYFMGIESIIPSLIAYSLATGGALLFYRATDMKPEHRVTWKETFDTGRSFLLLGGLLTVSSFVEQLCSYAFTAYLNIVGTDVAVGYYQSGYTLINKYVGLIFAALGMEYYPRLSRVCGSILRTRVYVSHEMSIIMIMIVPVSTVFITAVQLVIKILYSVEFLDIVPFVVTSMVGMVFRGFSWCYSFMLLAWNRGRVFVLIECISSVTGLILNVIAYKYYGINGLGLSFTVWYLIYSIMVVAVSLRMGVIVSRRSVQLLLYALFATTLQVVFFFIFPTWVQIAYASATTIFSLILLLKLSGSRF